MNKYFIGFIISSLFSLSVAHSQDSQSPSPLNAQPKPVMEFKVKEEIARPAPAERTLVKAALPASAQHPEPVQIEAAPGIIHNGKPQENENNE